jgi:high-affinity iron transporter
VEQALFIVWRESIEALLVVGILYAWLRRQPNAQTALRYLWTGVGLGLLLAGTLALLMLWAGQWLSGTAGEYFQAGMTLLASLLIMQMLGWMARNGGQLRQQLEGDAGSALAQGRYLGLLLLAALAVGREGGETVIFLYGIGSQQVSGQLGQFALGGALGLLLGGLCFALLQAGSRVIGWRQFFRVSEWLLMLLGGALLMSALDRISGQLLGLELPNLAYQLLGDPLWNSSALLDDGSRGGALFASLTGYRAMPSALAVLLLAGYWWLARRLTQGARLAGARA